MDVLRREDPRFLEIMRALLQLMRLMNERELYELFAVELKKTLDKFLLKANFFSYLKRNHEFPIFAHPGCYEVLEALCGENHSSKGDQNNLSFKRIEQFRNKSHWKKITFNQLEEGSRYPTGNASMLVMVYSTEMQVFNDEAAYAASDWTWGHHVFILSCKDKNHEHLIINYAYERKIAVVGNEYVISPLC